MLIIQSLFMRLLSPIDNSIVSKKSVLRDTISYICLLVLIIIMILGQTNKDLVDTDSPLLFLITLSDRGRTIIGMGLLIVVALVSVNKKPNYLKWRWFVVALWMVGSILIIITGAFHSIGNGLIINQITIMIVFPSLYFIWQNNGNIEKIFSILSNAYVTVIIGYTVICMIYYPYETATISGIRYCAATTNPNTLAMIALSGGIASMYLISQSKRLWALIYMITLGFSWGFLVLTLSRASILAMSVSSIIWIILSIKSRKSLKLVISTILIACISLMSFYFISCRWNDVFGLTSAGSITYAANDNSTSSDSGADAKNRFDDYKNANQYSAGRIEIWKIHLQNLTYSGNDVSYTLPIRVVMYDGSGIRYYSSAHNSALEIAYRAGIPSGIIYICIEVLALVYALRRLFCKRSNMESYDIFSIITIISFIIISMFESIEICCSREITLLFYFALIPFFLDEREGK